MLNKVAYIVAILATVTFFWLHYMSPSEPNDDDTTYDNILTRLAAAASSRVVGLYSSIWTHNTPDGLLLTKEELKNYKFKYLAIAGEVFDVSTGERHYGKDGHYNFFTGIDGTRAFVSGDFTEEGLQDDIKGLDQNGIQTIEDWRLMYYKNYKYIGKLVGTFYESNGMKSAVKLNYERLLTLAEKSKLDKKEFMKLYPPCNSEYTSKGSRVWCSDRSGGIQRSWVGVPRKLFTPGDNSFRCTCVRTVGPPSSDSTSDYHSNRGDLDNPNLHEYKNCPPTSESCLVL